MPLLLIRIICCCRFTVSVNCAARGDLVCHFSRLCHLRRQDLGGQYRAGVQIFSVRTGTVKLLSNYQVGNIINFLPRNAAITWSDTLTNIIQSEKTGFADRRSPGWRIVDIARVANAKTLDVPAASNVN